MRDRSQEEILAWALGGVCRKMMGTAQGKG